MSYLAFDLLMTVVIATLTVLLQLPHLKHLKSIPLCCLFYFSFSPLFADVKWEFEPDYGEDIAKEHEKYIVDYFGGPVFVTDWPKEIKAYYMKVNPDNKTVAAVDLLVPQAGELMGGSQREENLDKLLERMEEMGVDKEPIDWYLDTRRYGGCIHSGFRLMLPMSV